MFSFTVFMNAAIPIAAVLIVSMDFVNSVNYNCLFKYKWNWGRRRTGCKPAAHLQFFWERMENANLPSGTRSSPEHAALLQTVKRVWIKILYMKCLWNMKSVSFFMAKHWWWCLSLCRRLLSMLIWQERLTSPHQWHLPPSPCFISWCLHCSCSQVW